jgi:hypothetical protein
VIEFEDATGLVTAEIDIDTGDLDAGYPSMVRLLRVDSGRLLPADALRLAAEIQHAAIRASVQDELALAEARR